MPSYDSFAVLVLVLDFRIPEEGEHHSPAEDEGCHNLVEEVDYHNLDQPEKDCRNQEVEGHHIHGHLEEEDHRSQIPEEEGHHRNHDLLEEEDHHSLLGQEVLQYL